jgi:predicted  nucleic acid-binding Zn-ribbon protein
MQAMTASMVGLKQAAESGSFAISEDGAQAYLKAIDAAQKDLRKLDREIARLGQETKLGTSPDGAAMARYNQESVEGGAGTTGIVPVIEQLRTALNEAREALQKAIENYREVDSSNASTYQRY